jgi:hypothetical protein
VTEAPKELTMETPDSLPARLFLLAYDPSKGRLTARTQLGLILRAAALAELAAAGHLVDRDGRPELVGAPTVADPVLATVLDDVAAGRRPRKWQYWVQHRARKLPDLVRDQLAEARIIRVERERFLGLFPQQKLTLRDPRARQRLVDTARRTLRGGQPTDRVDPRDAVTVVLAAAGEVNLVVDRKQRREFKRRLEALSEHGGPMVPALRKALTAQRAAAASA